MLTDLYAWARRRPLDNSPGHSPLIHSSDIKTNIWLITGSDLISALVIDLMIPPPLRPIHLGIEVILLVVSLGVAAMIARSPHLIDGGTLYLRTGPLGQIQIPLDSIRTVSTAPAVTPGCGVRRVPGAEGTIACSVAGTTALVLDLDTPVVVRLRKGPPVSATQIRFTADSTSTAVRTIRAAIDEAKG
ncbi:hypothetical protein GCM10027589_13260 [Actinocorallia lasiicapitis]